MKKLVDTNILLESPLILENPEFDLVISIKVVKELDGLKRSTNQETAEKARRAAIYLSRKMNELKFDQEDEAIPTDDLLLKIAKKNSYGIITNDVYLKIRARAQGIPFEGYSYKEDYDGVLYIQPEQVHLIAKIFSGDHEEILPFLRENQYVIINTEKPSFYKKTNNKLVQVRYGTIENDYENTIKPRNNEQVCLVDLLNNDSITIAYAGGAYGKGKSYLINNYALQQLERGSIKSIVYIPNNAYVANTLDLGALPGDLFDKSLGQIGPLVDLIGIDRVKRLMEQDQLEILPINYSRGRSFTNSIIIVNEAQNLTTEHVKLLIGRVGEGSKILFDGDIKQTDSPLFKNKNGIQLLLKLSDSPTYSHIFGTVKLLKTERSFTAQAADELERIEMGAV